MNVVEFATKYCAILKRNLTIKSKCGPLKILCNQCGPLCFTGSPPLFYAQCLMLVNLLKFVGICKFFSPKKEILTIFDTITV